jgi:hypothetical protein
MIHLDVKTRYNLLLVGPWGTPSLSLSSPPMSSLFSLFAPERVFASPSFPDTYSLFQNEDSHNPINPKDLFTLSQNTRVSPHPSSEISSRPSSLSPNSAPSVLEPTRTPWSGFSFSPRNLSALCVSALSFSHRSAFGPKPSVSCFPSSPLQSTLTKKEGRAPLLATHHSSLTTSSSTHRNPRKPSRIMLVRTLSCATGGYLRWDRHSCLSRPTTHCPLLTGSTSTLAPHQTRCQNDANE